MYPSLVHRAPIHLQNPFIGDLRVGILPATTTGADGRLVPGLRYNLAVMDAAGATRIEQIKWPGLGFTKLILKPGEMKKLGDVKLQPFPNSRHRRTSGVLRPFAE